MSKTKVELIDKISRAFKNVEHPGRKIGDLEELRKWTKLKRKDVAVEDVNVGITFFSHKGLQYFLPVFLINILNHPDKVDHPRIISNLREYDRVPPRPNRKLCESFTEEQRQIIVEFLEYYEQHLVVLPSEDEMKDWSVSLKNMAKQRYVRRIEENKEMREYWMYC